MKVIFFILVLINIFLSAQALNYTDKIFLEKNDMVEEYNKFFTNFYKAEKYKIIDDYIKSSNIYLDTLVSKPPFYVYKEFEFDFYGHFVKFYSDNILVSANSNYFKVFSINEDKLSVLFESDKFDRIDFIDILDSDNDKQKEIFIISKNDIFNYIIEDNRVRLSFKDENIHGISTLYKINMKSKNFVLCGKILESSMFIYRSDSEKLHYFKWLFPGYDKKHLVIDEELLYKKIYFHDINQDSFQDIIICEEKSGNIDIQIYLNDRFDNFAVSVKLKHKKTGFIDIRFNNNDIYILTIDSLFKGRFKDGNLIIEKNSFNIDGCLAFDFLNENIYLFTVEGKLKVLKKLL
ncbi:MAG: hypothetical protein M0Q02_07670 [Candidatus Muirbacterium halophilum]|nr:hypothetical protein [Candidatus Muirbacterium halophilum]